MKKNFTLLLFFLTLHLNAQQKSITEIDKLCIEAKKFTESDPEHAIKLNTEIFKQASAIGYHKGMMISQLRIAMSYHNVGIYEKVIEFASRAQEEAKIINDYEILTDAIRFQAISYIQLNSHDRAVSLIHEALPYTFKIKDKNKSYISKGSLYLSLSSIYYDNEAIPLDSAIKYNRKSIDVYKLIRPDSLKESFLDASYMNLGENFLEMQELDSAEFYLNKGLQLAIKTNSKFGESQALHSLGLTYHKRGDFKRAIELYNSSLTVAKSIKNFSAIKILYQDLSESYDAINDEKNTKIYLSKFGNLSDSLEIVQKNRMNKILKVIVDGKENNFKKEKESFYKLIATVILLLIISIVVVFQILKKLKIEKLDNQHKEFLLKEKTDLLATTENKVNSVTSQSLEDVVRMAINNDSGFLQKFKELYPDFIKKLFEISPTINSSDLKLAALLKLDFTTKEIAIHTKSSVRSVEAKKYRLRKKLNIPSEDDMNVWMINL